MTFEETVIFYNPEHADEFVSKLKKAGYKAKSRKVSKLVRDTVCTGRLDDFISLFSDKKEECAGNAVQNGMQEIFNEVFSEFAEELISRREQLSEFLGSAGAGDCISDIDGIGEFMAQEKEFGDEGWEEYRRTMLLINILDENELIERRDGGLYLKGKAEPGGMVTGVPPEMVLDVFTLEERVAYNVHTLINVMSGLEVHVSLPPEFLLAGENELIDAAMEEYDVDEESFLRLSEDAYIKSLLADRILGLLKESEKVTFEDLFEDIGEMKFSASDTNEEFYFDLDENFLKELLADMKRLGILKIKGNRYKVS